ncbi:hypothetical protein AAVH_23527 [Aphelenchoides avenae]|nr:hypothetical protein AAVH_23527 [Aphelenchus avenae]
MSEAFKQKCTKCPPGYTFVPASGKCFTLHRIPKGQPAGWSDYRRACQSLPGDEWARSTADLAAIHGEPAQGIAKGEQNIRMLGEDIPSVQDLRKK